jgi:hypothetical protein
MNIKNKIVAALTLAVLVAPGISLAQTMSVAQLQTEIQSLTAQLQSLETQLAAAGESTAWCYSFNDNLSIGMSGAAVTALQTALQKDGESVTVNGTFNDQTASAVTAFQEKYQSQILAPYGLSYGTGYAGKSTRAELNSLFGCTGSNPVTPPIVVNPVGPAPVVPPVSTTQNLTIAPTNLSFTVVQNSTNNQSLAITAPSGATWSVSTNPPGNTSNSWLAVTYPFNCGNAACGNGSINVIADAYNGLTVGTYNGSIIISGSFTGSPESIPVTLNVTSEATTPTTPTVSQVQGLSATAASNAVALNWQPATASDNGTVIYNIYRTFTTTTCTNAPGNYYIAQVHGTSYTDSPLPTGIYYYCIQSQDTTQNNVGPLSAQVSATVSGSTVSTSTSWNNIVVNPLSTLSINVSTNGQGSLTLSWPAATSTNGIALYNVYRGTQDLFTLSSSSLIGQVNALSYTDSNLANGVYYYAVVPQDVSGKTALSTYTHSSVTNVASPAGSTFTIQADPGNPAATQVSTGATGATLLRFDITNPLSHPLRITQLPGLQEVASASTQQPVGESSPDFNSVSLYSMASGQNVLVGTFPSFTSSQTPGAFWNATMYLSNLTIPANTTQEFTITGNVPSYNSGAANVGTEGGILLSGSSIIAIDGVTNASISGSGTAAGNPITITQGQ